MHNHSLLRFSIACGALLFSNISMAASTCVVAYCNRGYYMDGSVIGKDGNTYYQICVRCPGITLVNGTKAHGTTLSAGANRYTDCFMPAGSGYVAINGVYDFVDACQYK